MSIVLDFGKLLADLLQDDQRANDGKLHPSSHLLGSLRHTQLDVAGAPKKAREFTNSMRLHLGTMSHEWVHDSMRRKGIPHMPEVKLDPWLPEGWAGTADCFLWDAEHKAFALLDYKTIEGKGMYWIDTQGPKDSHIWQVSAYLYAAESMGLPVFTDEGYILYIPITEGTGTHTPSIEVVKPIPKDELHSHMNQIKSQTDKYLRQIQLLHAWPGHDPRKYITDELAAPPQREQKLFWDKNKKVWDLKLVPPWGARYCPYEAPLCTCSGLATSEKVGEYDLDRAYSPRDGYKDVVPVVTVSDTELNRRNPK